MTIEKIGSQTFTSNDIRPQQVDATDRSTFTLNEGMQQSNVYTNSNTKNEKVEKETVEEAVDGLNEFLKPVRRNLKFELHDKLEKYYVTVVDSDTSEVIKEIPPKKILDMYAAMAEFMGLLVDRKV